MKVIVRNIIKDIGKDLFFDSHFIIDTIIRNHSDAYLRFAYENPARDKITENIHAKIAKLISGFDGILVERVTGEAISYNIRGNPSNCAIWQRK